MVGLLLPLTGWFPDPVLPFVAPITLILLGLLPSGIDDRAALSFESGGPTRVRIGLALAALSGVIYWLADRQFDAGRGDLFYLADAFLHGRTWLTPGWDRTTSSSTAGTTSRSRRSRRSC